MKKLSTKRVKLFPDTPTTTHDTMEVGCDYDLDLDDDDTSKSKPEDHTPPPECFQVNHQVVRLKDPMKIKLVLERVFDFCSVESLKNCRLVSTEWRDESLKAWRDKAVLQCTTASEDKDHLKLKEYLQLLESDEVKDDDDAAKFRNLKKRPFKRFCVFVADYVGEFSTEMLRPISSGTCCLGIHSHSTSPYDISIGELKEFLSKFRTLEALHFQLSFVDFYYPESLHDFKLPTVKRLCLEICQKYEYYSDAEASWGWGVVLKWFPNLETLSIKYEGIRESKFLENLIGILRSVQNIRESEGESVLALKELELLINPNVNSTLFSPNSDEIIRLIIDCNFPLEGLSITLGCEKIYELLDSCKSTLQYLSVSLESDFDFKQLCKSICMGKLKELSIGNGCQRAMDFLTLLELPQLKKLTIRKLKDEYFHPPYLSKGRIYEELETLEFLDNQAMPLPYMVETFAKMMPNLMHLTMPLDKATFEVVCGKFRGLKTLNILSAHDWYEGLDDESITGISKIAEEGTPRRPNITDLALLTDLKVSCDWQLMKNRFEITDHSVIHGFLKLPRLHSLNIAFRDLSEDIKTKLSDHVKGNLCIQEKPIHVEIVEGWETDWGGGYFSEGESDYSNDEY